MRKLNFFIHLQLLYCVKSNNQFKLKLNVLILKYRFNQSVL